MLDVDYLMGLRDHPNFEDLILAYECLQELGPGGKTHLIDAIHRLGLPPDTAYRRLRKLEVILGEKPGSLIKKKPGKGASQPADNPELFRNIEETVRAYERLRKCLTVPGRTRVRLGATNICLLRLVPEIYRKFRGPTALTEGSTAAASSGASSVALEFHQGEWYDLIRDLSEARLDVALTTCPPKLPPPYRSRVRVLKEVKLPRCLIYPMNHRLNNEGDDWEKEFHNDKTRAKAWKRLSEETLIVLGNERAEPDFPWTMVHKLYDPRQWVEVDTYAHAHALVLAGGGVAFTHQELLGEEEEQYLTAVDVSQQLGSSRLCALLSLTARAKRTKAENEAIDGLSKVMAEYLEDMAGRVGRSGEFAYLRDYRYLWHTTTGKSDVPTWMPGTVRLRTTPAGYVKGVEQGKFRQVPFRIFGHVLDRHIIWHGISADAEAYLRGRKAKGSDEVLDHYAIDFYVTEPGAPLVGTWVGKDYAGRRRSGVAVLHTDEIKGQELNAIVKRSGMRHLDKAEGEAHSVEG